MGTGLPPRIALVDDEPSLRELLGQALRKEGYRVSPFADGQEAWEGLRQDLPDLAILDIILPRMDGLELCRRLRQLSEPLPLMFLTSRDEEFDRVLGLELGADDYLCKPFSVRELMARVKVLLRRARSSGPPAPQKPVLRRGCLELDRQRHLAAWKGCQLQLTVTEFRMLEALAREPGQVRTREQLLQEGYPHDEYMGERSVDCHIKRLRRKLQQADPSFDAIQTIYGLGYRYRLDA